MGKKIRGSLASQLLVLVLLLFGFLLVVASFSVNIDWPSNLSFIDKYVYQHRFFSDFFLVGAIAVLLLGGNIIFKVVGTLLALVFTSIYFVQSQSYSITGKYLPSIALENADHANFLDINHLTTIGGIWLVGLLVICIICGRLLGKLAFKSVFALSIMMLVASVLIKNDKHWLSEQKVADRYQFYSSGRPGVKNSSPITELLETIEEFKEYLAKQNYIKNDEVVLTPLAEEFALNNFDGFRLLSAVFPLMREMEFRESLLFLDKDSSDEDGQQDKKNIIIFFAEGMSAKLIQPYEYRYYPALTPNIDEFSKENIIRVNNYFNHTFATYRGIGGQLCSMFPVGRLYEEVNYYCLGHALSERGYQSHFMVSQRLDSTDLDRVFKQAGFDGGDGTVEIAKLLSLPNPDEFDILPDRVLMDGLIARLKELEQSKDAKPAMFSIYNIETHTGRDLIEKKTVYTGTNKVPIEPNIILNTFHNFDKEFGRFWDYFKNSSLYDNTIVVLTSDHATYPSRGYNELMGVFGNHKSIFTDRIPLLIYDPRLSQPIGINARRRNSLDLAPTLLHLLGVKGIIAPFIGTTLFTKDPSPYARTSGSTSRMWFFREPDRWRNISNSMKADRLELYRDEVSKYEFIQFMDGLEQANRIWPTQEQMEVIINKNDKAVQ